MSLYAKYLEERTNDHIIESASGFVTYRYINDGKTVYIIDVYTIPEERKRGYAAILADMVAEEAREKGCIEMWGTVQPTAKNSTSSMRVLLAYGMELLSASNDCVIFRKDL